MQPTLDSYWKLLPLVLLAACGQDPAPAATGQAGEAQQPDEVQDLSLVQRERVLKPETARWSQVQQFEEDLLAPRHPADGGGRAWIEGQEDERPTIGVAQLGEWPIIYEAGEHGIAAGGSLYFMPEPFWQWSQPQTFDARRPGFTQVSCALEGLEIETHDLGAMLQIVIQGRALRAGEQVHIHYGAGVTARADIYAERGARLWLAVDGDGDGVRKIVADSPLIDVLAGPPAKLVLNLTSCAQPGARVRLTVALLDALGNAEPRTLDDAAQVLLRFEPELGESWEFASELHLNSADSWCTAVEFTAAEEGILRLSAVLESAGVEIRAESNPLWISADAPALYWGDLHGHSNLSDGTGSPRDYLRYARDIAGLDVVALTDHDHFGVRFIDQHPALWQGIKDTTASFLEEGRFLPLLGYEWTSWIHGHRHVLYFDGEGAMHSSLDPEVRTPDQLWARLRDSQALTFAHHSAGNPVPTNWSFPPDPVLEPVTEIMSVHGSSEALDSPERVGAGIPGNFVRDVLDHGHRLGFIGSGDSHDGHPGLPHLNPQYGFRRDRRRPGNAQVRMGRGGLAGLYLQEFSRAGVLATMRARRVYATSGPRIILHVQLNGAPMGSIIGSDELPEGAELEVLAIGTAHWSSLELVRSGTLASVPIQPGSRLIDLALPLGELQSGEYIYVRLGQVDGGLAWSSPIFIE